MKQQRKSIWRPVIMSTLLFYPIAVSTYSTTVAMSKELQIKYQSMNLSTLDDKTEMINEKTKEK